MKSRFLFFFLLFVFALCDAQDKWTKAFNASRYLKDVSYMSEAVGIAVGDKIHITLDSGRTWATKDAPPAPDFSFFIFEDVNIVSPTNILLTGNTASLYTRVIYRSEDTCKTFQLVHSESNTSNLFNTSFYNDKIGMTFGSNGVILKTVDGGKTWAAPVTALASYVMDLLWIDSLNIFASTSGSLMKTTDGGTTWSEVLHRKADFKSILSLGTDTLLLGGWDFDSLRTSSTILLLSKDKGATWTKIENNLPALADMRYDAINKRVLFGTINGCYRSSLDFTTWEQSLTKFAQILAVHLNSTSTRITLVENNNLWRNAYANALFIPFVPIILPAGPYCQSVPWPLLGPQPASYDYKWYVDDSLVATGPNPKIVFPKPRYNVQLRLIVSNGFTKDTVSQIVDVQPQPTIPSFELATDYDAYCFNAKAKIWIPRSDIELFMQLKKGDSVLTNFDYYYSLNNALETPPMEKTTKFTVNVRRTTICGVNYAQKDITLKVLPNYQSITQVEVRDQPVCKLSDTTYLKVYPTAPGTVFEYYRMRNPFAEQASLEGQSTANKDTTYLKLSGFYYYDNPVRINVGLPCLGNSLFTIDSVKVPVYGAKMEIAVDQTAYYLDEPVKVKMTTNLESFSIGFRGEKKKLTPDSTVALKFGTSKTEKVVFYGYKGKCVDSSFKIVESLTPLLKLNNVCKRTEVFSDSSKPWLFKGLYIATGAQDLLQDMTVLPTGETVYGGIFFNPDLSEARMAKFFIACVDDKGQTLWEHRDTYQLGWYNKLSASTCTQVESDEEGNVYFSGTYTDPDDGLVLFGIPFPYQYLGMKGYVISLDRKGAFRWVYFLSNSSLTASNPTQLRYVASEQKLYLTAHTLGQRTNLIVLDKAGEPSSTTYLGMLSFSARENYPSNLVNSSSGIYSANSYHRVPQFEYLQNGSVMMFGNLPYTLSGFYQDNYGFEFRPWFTFASRVDTSSGCLDFYPLKDTVPNYHSAHAYRPVSHSLSGRMVHVERKTFIPWYGGAIVDGEVAFAEAPDKQFAPAELHTISSHDLVGHKEEWQVQMTNFAVRDLRIAANGNTYVLGGFANYFRIKDSKGKNGGLKTNIRRAVVLLCLDASGALLWTYELKADSANYYLPYLLEVNGNTPKIAYLAASTDPYLTPPVKGRIYKEIISTEGNPTSCDVITALGPSLFQKKQVPNWTLYPNPNNGTQLHASKSISGKIMDINGQLLLVFHDLTSIDVSSLAKGMYTLQTNEGEVQKFVVE